ncbi:MAG TPA: hypothetical protein VNJ10_14370 [Sphingomonas sp.]|nr:hypothetical protein [Sphingomonas sp.]
MTTSATQVPWWERRWLLAAIVLACAIPLLWPALPPLSDLPGHMGRWHIAMALHDSPSLARYYDYAWAPIPNLGLDLLVPAVSQVLAFETATKVVVIAIPVLTAAGLLWTAYEAHGRVPPTAIFALPMVYAWPFQFGFVNFTLSQALAFCALALWLRWGRSGRLGLRAVVFVPVACLLWLAHSFGWGLFGLMAAAAELARLRGQARHWPMAIGAVIVRCLPLAVPLLFMINAALQAPAGDGARGLGADDWFDVAAKATWIASILRDRWQVFDILSLIPFAAILYLAARSPKLHFAAVLGWQALACAAAFALLPRLMMGGAYVDMRMAPAALMLALIAIAPPVGHRWFAHGLALAGTAFLIVRLVGTSVSFVERAGEQQRELAAIAHIPRGAAVLALVRRPCGGVWSDLRRDALPGMAIVRRDVFTNTQWALAGQQLLRVRHIQAAPYTADPSQLVRPAACAERGTNFAQAIGTFPRAAFTHVWTLGFRRGEAQARDLRLIWTNGESSLYRVVR